MKKLYGTVLADPPWPYHSPKAIVGNGGRGKLNIESATQVNVLEKYDVMPLDEIMGLPVRDLVADNAHLYLWTTNSFLCEAHEVAKKWGFKPKTLLTWVKVKADGSPSMSVGHWFRSATEHILFCVRGKKRLMGSKPLPTAYLSPRLPHSVKPDFFYGLIEGESPGPFLELFARRNRAGWDSWGNEVPVSADIFGKNA
jgi:N6-adenosine-specific RNA methylase IME4